ncbi:MAG: outer membrane lipoprotein-sorting protein [Deltaproteobacteria bacterium]|jgi:hypothetical protein|nr:outer membrane lipoprotein-sorting protein [Deltaproteobacteria bacterium]MBW2534980.1 outer membrane lipoprotein-sorting protein [Deltaproteobacteria bacterium]
MLTKRIFVLSLLVAASLLVAETSASAPSALALMEKADARHRLDSETTTVRFVLQKVGGKKRKRLASVQAVQDDGDGDRMRLRFVKPAKVRRLELLSIENRRGGDDDQWLYLPAFGKTRRVGVAELGDRFVSTDLYFEDLKRRRPKDFSHRILRSETMDGHDCWVIESKPKSAKTKAESPYGKTIVWLRKDIFFVIRSKAFDRRGKLIKETKSEKLVKVLDQRGGVWRANKAIITDLKRRHRTTLLVKKRKVNSSIDDEIFSRHTLGD